MNPFIQFDEKLFRVINEGMANPSLDPIMRFLSGYAVWGFLIAFTVVAMRGRSWKFRLAVIALSVMALLLTDFVCFYLIKLKFVRLRPCLVMPVRLVVSTCGNAFSFPSNHAANSMVLATVWSYFLPWRASLMLFATAFAIGFSRIYVGVHFPTDVLGGLLIGSLFGRITARFALSVFHGTGLDGAQELT